MTVSVSKRMRLALVMAVSAILIITVLPVCGFAEPMLPANAPGSLPAVIATDDPVPVLYHQPAGIVTAPTQGLTVKPWTPATFALGPPTHSGWVSSDQIVSGFAALARDGTGMSYPGGLAADIGGGGSMGGSGGGGGCGCGG